MRLQDNPYLPGDVPALVRQLDTLWRQLATQVNQISEGQLSAVNNAANSAPTGTAIAYRQGDFVRNSQPAELGAAGSRYVVHGWICTVAGSPGTWVQARYLTGN